MNQVKTPLTLRTIDAAFFPHIVQEMFDHAHIESLWALSRVSRSFRAAACRRLWPLEHFDLRVVEVPYDPHRDENEWFLYEVSGEGVRFLAVEQEFDWGEQDGDFYRAGGSPPIWGGERPDLDEEYIDYDH